MVANITVVKITNETHCNHSVITAYFSPSYNTYNIILLNFSLAYLMNSWIFNRKVLRQVVFYSYLSQRHNSCNLALKIYLMISFMGHLKNQTFIYISPQALMSASFRVDNGLVNPLSNFSKKCFFMCSLFSISSEPSF